MRALSKAMIGAAATIQLASIGMVSTGLARMEHSANDQAKVGIAESRMEWLAAASALSIALIAGGAALRDRPKKREKVLSSANATV